MAGATLTLLALAVAVQLPQAEVRGVVRDADTGLALDGATVLLPDLDRGTLTDADGRYVLLRVPPGPQHVAVSYLGHATRTVHALVPSSGALTIDVSLAAEPIRLEGLDVRPAPALRGLEPGVRGAFADRTLTREAIRSHPTLAEPDALLALAGGEVGLDPEAPSGVHLRGGAADHTAYSLDGIPVFDPLHVAGLVSAWNVDALSDVSVSSVASDPGGPDALSGVVSARIREPGSRFGSAASLSTTHTGATGHGPLGGTSFGFVVSVRSGFPDVFVPDDEASYLRGETADAIVKISGRMLGGDLGLLFYDAENEVAAASLPTPSPDPTANRFEWDSESVGARWSRSSGFGVVELKAWRATARAASTWWGEPDGLTVDGTREETGLQATVGKPAAAAAPLLGIRLRRLRTGYTLSGEAPASELPLLSVFGARTFLLGGGVEATVGASVTATPGRRHVAPSARVAWIPSEGWAARLSAARTHQHTQSLRNPESVVGHVFPATLPVTAGVDGVPVPKSDQVVLSTEWRAAPGVRLGVRGYLRTLDGLVLVAPGEAGPFSRDVRPVGDGAARGISVSAAGGGARLGWVADYGWQRVRFSTAASSYAPVHGTAHLVSTGLVAHPSASTSGRVSLSGGFGRRSSDVGGAFEWEACNLLDQGCEFAGSPTVSGPLGGRSLPPYLRVDLGARKHWHLRLRGRESLVAVHGTLTNVLGRANVLTHAVDAESGRPGPVTMRPLSPLVIGVEWRF